MCHRRPLCFLVLCQRREDACCGKSLKFPDKGRLEVCAVCHNDDILFATLDCEDDENYYHHYPN